MKKILFTSALLASCAAFADADVLNRPAGIKIGERITLRPYVCFSCTFDSNPDSERSAGNKDVYWTANPGFNLDYVGDNWKVSGNVYYQYHAYSSGRGNSLDNSSYGEQLGVSWSSASGDGASWGLTLSERYSVVNQNDDLSHSDGKGLWRDRQQFDVSAAFQRRFNEHWHASVNASYYWLDYANDTSSFAPLFGWGRWTAGAQVGCTLSQWTDLFVSGNYQGYTQDNKGDGVGSQSEGFTVHAGLASHMTERISYSVSAGYSQFEYGDKYTSRGFTYQGNLNWKFAETWSTTLLFSSYYQPSERERASSTRCDSISWGLAKSLVRGKLNATFDLAYRHDENEYSSESSADWDLNIITTRLALNYNVNRLLSVFARAEFQTELNGGEEISRHYDYERWRTTIGVKLSY